MALLVGIDEAGYGPLLGPLTVSSAAFRLPDDALRADHWAILKKAISNQKRGLSGRLLIADSKKAYNRKQGPIHLRRAVLSSLKSINPATTLPTTCAELALAICPDCFNRLGGYAWYSKLDEIPLAGDQNDVDIAAGVFSKALSDNEMQIISLTSRCLDVGYYNKMVATVKNKSRVLFTAIAGLIQQIFDMAEPGENIQIIVDRQGGRVNYRDPLQRMFQDHAISVLRQDPEDSSYEMTGFGKTMRIHFVVKADARFMPVCLASMASKYLREMLVKAINTYFLSHCEDIKPTAGYWQDGLRFVADLKKHLPELVYDENLLVRSR